MPCGGAHGVTRPTKKAERTRDDSGRAGSLLHAVPFNSSFEIRHSSARALDSETSFNEELPFR
jgi:hypothetical protein